LCTKPLGVATKRISVVWGPKHKLAMFLLHYDQFNDQGMLYCVHCKQKLHDILDRYHVGKTSTTDFLMVYLLWRPVIRFKMTTSDTFTLQWRWCSTYRSHPDFSEAQ
jgi:hypothetical protein